MTTETALTFIDQAINILRATSDGDEMDPSDLALLQDVVNTNGACLSELGRAKWQRLHDGVLDGSYAKMLANTPFCGVPGLSRSHQGYVFWKGVNIEHFSHKNADAMVRDARELGAVCLMLEAAGELVTGSSVMGFWMKMDHGYGLPLTHRSVAYRLEQSGPSFSVVNFLAGDAVEARARCSAHVAEFEGEWTKGDTVVSHVQVTTKEHYESLKSALESSLRWCRDRQWGEFQSSAVSSKLFSELEAAVNPSTLPSRESIRQQFLGTVLPGVIAQSEQLLAQASAADEQPALERERG